MTEPVDPSDPYGDPFAEDIHDPVVFALNGTDLLYERAQTARQRFEALLASDPAKNVLAISSRQRIKEPLAKLAVTSLSARMHAGRLRGLADHELDQAIIEWNGAYAEALRDLAEVERLGAFAATPDATSDPIPELPLPQVQDWTTVSALVQGDVASWAARVRGKKGQMLIAKPSPGTGKPLHEDTLITMADGSRKPIREIVVGDKVVSGMGRITTVEAVYDQGPLDVLRIETRGGRHVIAEASHRFMTSKRGWVEAGNLVPYDKINNPRLSSDKRHGDALVVRYCFERYVTVGSVDRARFFGYMMGDGHASPKPGGGCSWTNVDPLLRAKFTETVEALGGYTTDRNKITIGVRSPGPRRSPEDKRDYRRTWNAARQLGLRHMRPHHKHHLREMLKAHGLACAAHHKRVPKAMFIASNQEICEFIAAYFECDGTRSRPGVSPSASFSSVSRELLADIQTLLGRLGIRSSLRLKNGRYLGKLHVSWRLNILDLVRFFETVPVLGKKAGPSLASRRYEPKESQFDDMIISVTPAGRARCLCITVADDSSFLANDIVTHNTFAMVRTALHEQAQRQRVVMAVRTKEMLVSELEPRIRKAGYGTVRLHVIQGRDESTCWNFDNVRAVQEHGYAPGSTVCSRCEYHPDIAKQLRSYTVCPYYRSRQNAQNDTASARFGANDYPIIATTHSGYLTAVESGGGRFGKFWPCDMLMIDEDPTDAFEPEVIVKAEHLMLPTPPKPEDRAAHAMATLLSGVIAQAEAERKAMESRGWVMASGIPSPIHSRHGSAYAGNSLHALLDRVATGPLGQQHGFKNAIQVLRDVSDSHVHPAAGSLHGATTAAAVSLVVPPRGLSQIGEALFEENALRMDLRRAAYRKVNEREMPPTMTSAQVDAALAESEEFDPAYRVRLEFAKDEWRFVFQDFVDMLDQNTNSLYGDAYANIEHTRQIFDKPATDASNPSYVDPVTVINHVAKFPDGSTIVRERTRANITYLLNEGWGDHAARLAVILRTHAGLSVLIYGHGVLKPRVEKLFADNQNFGVAKWAFENWGGGRGKDQYGDWDAVITISDYVQNIGGMLHKVNARAARDTARLLARNKIDEALVEGTRISLDMNKSDVAHKMADPTTHWRIRQEHDRQNVSELAQALHRVRGLRSPKRMTVVGDGVPFTKDTIAASVVVNPPGGPAGRPKLKSGYVDGCLTEEEAYTAICQVEEHFGCWSPIFLHALLAIEVDLFHSMGQEGSSGGGDNLYRETLSRDCPRLPDSLSQSPNEDGEDAEMPGAHPKPFTVPPSLLRRVWFPSAEWKFDYQRALRELKRTKLASARASREFPFSGTYVPSWEVSTHSGYKWYSRHSVKTGAATFVEIVEHQYGINKSGVLQAPRQKPFIPW